MDSIDTFELNTEPVEELVTMENIDSTYTADEVDSD